MRAVVLALLLVPGLAFAQGSRGAPGEGDYRPPRIRLLDGTAALPALTFHLDQDTGFYSKAANQIGISTAGVLRFYVDAYDLWFGGGVANTAACAYFDGGNASFCLVTATQERFLFSSAGSLTGINVGGGGLANAASEWGFVGFTTSTAVTGDALVAARDGLSATPTALWMTHADGVEWNLPVLVATVGAAVNVTPRGTGGGGYLQVTCSEACTATLVETAAVSGDRFEMCNTSTFAITLADSAGVMETSSSVLGQYDCASFRYETDRWVQTGYQNN